MLKMFREIAVLRKKGKLHNTLVINTYALFFASLVMAGIISYNMVFRSVSSVATIALVIFGFLMGRYVFLRMSVINWDEDKEVVRVGRMDILAIAVLAAYLGSDFVLKAFLSDIYSGSVTTLLFAFFFGTIFGRAVGMVCEIRRVFKESI